jgi:hypothetical protein
MLSIITFTLKIQNKNKSHENHSAFTHHQFVICKPHGK